MGSKVLEAGRWRLHNLLAAGTGELRTHMADHFEVLRHILQHFKLIFV
jgi:hypothetical protein